MSGSMQHQMAVSLRDDVARLHEHVEKVDGKVDTMAVQVAVNDTHVTRMIKEQAETNTKIDRLDAKIEKLDSLKAQLLGGIAVIGFIVTVVVETLRIWFH